MDEFVYPSISGHGQGESPWSASAYAEIEKKLIVLQRDWESKSSEAKQVYPPAIQYLYKYRAFDPLSPARTTALLAERTQWASALASLNDPLEAAFRVDETRLGFAIAESIGRLARSRWYGCVCFTIDPICVQMWAHYAANHTGICIAYKRSESFLLASTECRPVRYRRNLAFGPELASDVAQIFWTKYEAWEYEFEWRLLYPRAGGYLPSGLLIPYGVIFGLRTPQAAKDTVRAAAPAMRFGQIEPGNEAFALRVRWEDADE